MGLLYSNIPELEGSDTSVVLNNLVDSEYALEVLIEKRIANLCELSEAIISDGGDADIVKSIVLSIRSESGADSGNVIDQNRQIADAIFSKFSLVERLTLFKEIFEKIDIEGMDMSKHLPLEESITVSDEASERIAYLKNSYNDIAYMQFSSLLNSPRAAYFGSISDVCESVYNGECEYCILPVETSGDGKLLSFYELLIKYNYKINAVYDLHGESGYTRYALISKKYGFGANTLRPKNKSRYFEFVLTENDSLSLADILSAAEFCSMKLKRIDTLNTTQDKNSIGVKICPVFRVDGADLQTFLAYLNIDCPDVEFLGLYTQI